MALRQPQSVPRQLVELSTQMTNTFITPLQAMVPSHQHSQSVLMCWLLLVEAVEVSEVIDQVAVVEQAELYLPRINP
jgi:hypothetical protein